MQLHAILPSFSALHGCISFRPHTDELIVTLINNEFFVIVVPSNSLSTWSQNNTIFPTKFLEKEPVMGITYDPARASVVILYSASYICTVDLNYPLQKKDAAITLVKKPFALEVDHRFAAIMNVTALEGELVVVERPTLHILADLPPTFSRAKYGT
jgi:hypothetical protein